MVLWNFVKALSRISSVHLLYDTGVVWAAVHVVPIQNWVLYHDNEATLCVVQLGGHCNIMDTGGTSGLFQEIVFFYLGAANTLCTFLADDPAKEYKRLNTLPGVGNIDGQQIVGLFSTSRGMSYVRPRVCCSRKPVFWGLWYSDAVVLNNGKAAVRYVARLGCPTCVIHFQLFAIAESYVNVRFLGLVCTPHLTVLPWIVSDRDIYVSFGVALHKTDYVSIVMA